MILRRLQPEVSNPPVQCARMLQPPRRQRRALQAVARKDLETGGMSRLDHLAGPLPAALPIEDRSVEPARNVAAAARTAEPRAPSGGALAAGRGGQHATRRLRPRRVSGSEVAKPRLRAQDGNTTRWLSNTVERREPRRRMHEVTLRLGRSAIRVVRDGRV